MLNTYRNSDATSRAPLAKVRFQVADLDKCVKVAICDDMADDILLGHDLGADTLGKWLLNLPSLPDTTVYQTRAQAAAQAEQDLADKAARLTSGTPRSLEDIFPFEDDIFESSLYTPLHQLTPPILYHFLFFLRTPLIVRFSFSNNVMTHS